MSRYFKDLVMSDRRWLPGSGTRSRICKAATYVSMFLKRRRAASLSASSHLKEAESRQAVGACSRGADGQFPLARTVKVLPNGREELQRRPTFRLMLSRPTRTLRGRVILGRCSLKCFHTLRQKPL